MAWKVKKLARPVTRRARSLTNNLRIMSDEVTTTNETKTRHYHATILKTAETLVAGIPRMTLREKLFFLQGVTFGFVGGTDLLNEALGEVTDTEASQSEAVPDIVVGFLMDGQAAQRTTDDVVAEAVALAAGPPSATLH
jgi:hypothetical protein